MYVGHWETEWDFDSNDWFGFVYVITHRSTGQRYVGKKQFVYTRVIENPADGTKRKMEFNSNDWYYYKGSNFDLNKLMERRGADKFDFKIVSLHTSLPSLQYAEARLQMMLDVLRARLPSGERAFFNRSIAAIEFNVPAQEEIEGEYDITWKVLVE